MIEDRFKEVMKAKTGCAVIIAGSDSDEIHIKTLAESMKQYHIPHTVRISSAHKQRETIDLVKKYNDVGGSMVWVAVAGGTDALSGLVSFHSLNPVLSSPPDGRNLSCLANPPGSSNLYIENPLFVAPHIARLYADANPVMRQELKRYLKVPLDGHTQTMQDLVVLGTSDDELALQQTKAVLDRFNVPYRCEVPDELPDLPAVHETFKKQAGIAAFIALSHWESTAPDSSVRPVLNCLRRIPEWRDPFRSTMPYVVRSDNAARAAAQIFAGSNDAVREALQKSIDAKIAELRQADARMRDQYLWFG